MRYVEIGGEKEKKSKRKKKKEEVRGKRGTRTFYLAWRELYWSFDMIRDLKPR